MQRLKGEQISYCKTQYVYYTDTIIDTPGEYTENGELAAALARGGCKSFILAHLSRENNEPCLAYEAAVNEIADRSVRVRVAPADAPCELCFDLAEV